MPQARPGVVRRASTAASLIVAIAMTGVATTSWSQTTTTSGSQTTATHDAASCGPTVEVAALGPACRAPDGLWRVDLSDGTHLFTHGPDPVPSDSYDARTSTPKPLACAADWTKEFHIEFFYAHPQGTKSNLSKLRGDLLKVFEEANGMMYAQAAKWGRPLVFRTWCAGGVPIVREVVLPTPMDQTDFGTVSDDMRKLGYTSPLVKHWIWFDGHPVGAAGTGSFMSDDRLAADNHNMTGAGYGITWGIPRRYGAAFVMLHEGSHNFGGVQLTARNTSGAAHCTDGLDVMCYPDGGSLAAFYRTTRCDVAIYDCGHDDYFNAAPKSGSYLATHWNIAGPYDRFVQGCSYRTGTLIAGLGGQDPEATAPAGSPAGAIAGKAFTIKSTCWGRPFSITGYMRPVAGTGEATAPLVMADVDVCFYAGSRLLSCYTGKSDRGSVPKGATKLRVILAAGAEAVFAFSAI